MVTVRHVRIASSGKRFAVAALAITDRRTYRALKNALTEIGEAVKRLPPEFSSGIQPWTGGWAGLRDMVAHQYLGLEAQRLRPTVADQLPLLLKAITAEVVRLHDSQQCGPPDPC